jgi:hypothetical protein
MPSTTTQPSESTPSTRQTTRSARAENRCRARNRDNTRCRHHADPFSRLCPKHSLRPTDLPEDTDLSHKFGPEMDDLSTAVHINAFLTTLVQCVVKNEISARRAAVIGYLTNQIIRTLPPSNTNSIHPPTKLPSSLTSRSPIAPKPPKNAAHFPAAGQVDPNNNPDDDANDVTEPIKPQAAPATSNSDAATKPASEAPPTPPPTPTFSRSQHQLNEYPVYRDPNYDDHWHPTGHLINRPPTTTPNPVATASPETKQRKPAA